MKILVFGVNRKACLDVANNMAVGHGINSVIEFDRVGQSEFTKRFSRVDVVVVSSHEDRPWLLTHTNDLELVINVDKRTDKKAEASEYEMTHRMRFCSVNDDAARNVLKGFVSKAPLVATSTLELIRYVGGRSYRIPL